MEKVKELARNIWRILIAVGYVSAALTLLLVMTILVLLRIVNPGNHDWDCP